MHKQHSDTSEQIRQVSIVSFPWGERLMSVTGLPKQRGGAATTTRYRNAVARTHASSAWPARLYLTSTPCDLAGALLELPASCSGGTSIGLPFPSRMRIPCSACATHTHTQTQTHTAFKSATLAPQTQSGSILQCMLLCGCAASTAHAHFVPTEQTMPARSYVRLDRPATHLKLCDVLFQRLKRLLQRPDHSL